MVFTDQTGREVSLWETPKRLVSLVPSQTELLIDLGLPVVGRTKFCIHPHDKVQQIEVVGGTKNLRLDAISALAPDLIVGNKEENERQQIQLLAEKLPVWLSDVTSIRDAIEMIESIGQITGAIGTTKSLVDQIESDLRALQHKFSGKVLYLIWQQPWMAAGPDTFVHSMLTHLGFTNIVKQPRYPVLDEYIVKELRPDHVFFSSEPFPFKPAHRQAFKALNSAHQVSVNGEMFSWYGSRLARVRSYFESNWLGD